MVKKKVKKKIKKKVSENVPIVKYKARKKKAKKKLKRKVKTLSTHLDEKFKHVDKNQPKKKGPKKGVKRGAYAKQGNVPPSDIIKIRKALRMSQGQFGALMGAHVMTVSMWERGLHVPQDYRDSLLRRFIKALAVPGLLGRIAEVHPSDYVQQLWVILDHSQ